MFMSKKYSVFKFRISNFMLISLQHKSPIQFHKKLHANFVLRQKLYTGENPQLQLYVLNCRRRSVRMAAFCCKFQAVKLFAQLFYFSNERVWVV
jgi:hypothetical protein